MTPRSMFSSFAKDRFRQANSEINVTPLVDVMLVLLVIFMATAPLLTSGLNVDLPKSSTQRPLETKDPIIVSLSADGAIAINDERIAFDALIGNLKNKIGGDDKKAIHIHGDRKIPYGDMVSLLDLLALNGFTRVAIVTKPGSSSKKLEQ